MNKISAIYGGRIDYRKQDYVFELRRALRRHPRRNATSARTTRGSTVRGSNAAVSILARTSIPTRREASRRLLATFVISAVAFGACALSVLFLR